MSEFFRFLTLIAPELWDMFMHLKDGREDERASTEIAMRIARRVSDEIALREIAK